MVPAFSITTIQAASFFPTVPGPPQSLNVPRAGNEVESQNSSLEGGKFKRQPTL